MTVPRLIDPAVNYTSPRLTRGNHLFPATVSLEDTGIIWERRILLVTRRTLIPYTEIASVRIRTGPLFGTVTVQASNDEAFEITLLRRDCARLASAIQVRLR